MGKYFKINSKFLHKNKMKRTGLWNFCSKFRTYKRRDSSVSQKIFDKLMIKLNMPNKKTNIIKFPAAPTKLERQVEAILFAASI